MDDLAYIDQVPFQFRSFVLSTKNVLGDGHCGFRCIADALGLGEESWPQVQNDLIKELTDFRDFYTTFMYEEGRVEKVIESLNCFKESVFENKYRWSFQEMYYVAASAYNIAIVHMHEAISVTFLPMRTQVPPNPHLVCMSLVQTTISSG